MVDKSKLSVDELRKYRVQITRDAASWRKPDRVPHMSFYISWPVLDAGYNFYEGLYDWNIMEECMIEHEKKYDFDMIQCLGTRNPMKITEALGVQKYLINDSGDFMNILDEVYVEHEDLKDIVEDPVKVWWTKVMPRKYPMFKPGIGVEPFANAYKEVQEMTDYVARINDRMTNELGLAAHSSPLCPPAVIMGIESFATLRGLRGMSISMRRDPQLLKDAAYAIDQAMFDSSMLRLEEMPEGPDMNTAMDAFICIMCGTIMNNKQFEFFEWDDRVKPYIDKVVAKGKQLRMYYHGSLKRYYDYYKDYPKGSLIFMSEDEDAYEVRANMPNVAICGGLSTMMMGHDTPEQCVAYVKKLINEIGHEGRLILCINTMGMYRQDTKAENLKAIANLIQTYQPQ